MDSQPPEGNERIRSLEQEGITIQDDVAERSSKKAKIENSPQKEEAAKAARLAKCESEVKRIARVMSLDQPLIDQASSNLAQICNTGGYNREFRLVAASAVYITLRLNSQPFTLMEIADKVPCDLFSLGKIYNKIMMANPNFCFTELDLALFVEKKCELLAVPEVHQEIIKRLAVRILSVLKDNGILSGRRRETIAASAIFFAAKSLGFKEYDVEKISAALSVPKSTVSVRVREMKAILMAQAKEKIPWATFPEKDLHRYLITIVAQLEAFSRAVAHPTNVVVVADDDSDKIHFLTKPPIITKTEPVSPPSSPRASRNSLSPSSTPTPASIPFPSTSLLSTSSETSARAVTPKPALLRSSFPSSLSFPPSPSPPKYPPAPIHPSKAKLQKTTVK